MKFIALFLSVIIGIFIGTQTSKNQQYTKLMLVFSAGFLFTVCVMEMFPIVFEKGGQDIGIWIIAGVLLQIILEYFSKGIEHGHSHNDDDSVIPFGLVTGLLIHSFLEGLPIGDTHQDIAINDLWIAVALHKLPIAVMYAHTINNLKIDQRVKYSLYMLFAFATPIGMYCGEMIPENTMIILYALDAGIFLHISSLIIFESNKDHSFNLKKLAVLLIGVIAGLFI